MSLSPLGPSKRAYLGLALAALVVSGVVQGFLVEPGRRAAFGPPRKFHPRELGPVLLGGFRGAMVSGLAYYAQESEVNADIYTARSSIKTLTELQPEFEHLWIYYSWVTAYNLAAVISPLPEKYAMICDGVAMLDKGTMIIRSLYEGRRPFVNERCPIRNRPVTDADNVPDQRRTFKDRVIVFPGVDPTSVPVPDEQTVLFADATAALEWDQLNHDQQAVRLELVRGGSPEYKRKRATMLWMLGWTIYQRLSFMDEARKHYRAWYVRDTGRDPYQDAYYYLSLASAVDVAPYQVSYEVLKTGPVYGMSDWARALAEDPKVETKVVAEFFTRAKKEWEVTLPFVPERKRVQHSVDQTDLVSGAMDDLAAAEKYASEKNAALANACVERARGRLDELRQRYRDNSYEQIYWLRLDISKKRVAARLSGVE